VSDYLVGSASPLLDVHDLLVLDLDGVVYVGPDAVPGAVHALEAAVRSGTALRYATNNAARPPEVVAEHLRTLGLPATADEVVTASQAAAAVVADRLGAGARVLAVGGPGVAEALSEVGLVPVTSADDEPAAVVQGYGPDVGWRQLTEAALAVRAGALWVATNLDATLPTPRGQAPGNGSLVAAVRTATGAEPLVAGKPEPGLFRLAARGAGSPLAVGDRLDTDIAAARNAGMPSLLVLTGVSGPEQLLGAVPAERPDAVAADLSGLSRAHPAPSPDGDAWVCGSAVARVRDGRLVLESPGDAGPDRDGLDGLRAAAAAGWQASDAGTSWTLEPSTAAALVRPDVLPRR